MIPLPKCIKASLRRAKTWRPLYSNPLVLDKHGLFLEYMRAFNDTSDTVEYERPNKYNFKLRGNK